MISSKAIITYKRKHQFSHLKLTHGLNGTNSTPEAQRIISSTRFSKKTEPGQFSEKQKGRDQIVCKEEDRNLQYSSTGCASKTKIGHCSDEEQETQGSKLVGSPVAEGVQEENSDQCLPSLHSRADDNVQECHCPFKYRETSSTDMTNETKQLGCSVAHLEGSVTPGSLNPIVTEQSCCKLSIGVTRSSDRARVLDLMEISEQIVQEASYNRTLNDENLCPSSREFGVKHEHTCNAKASSVLSKDMSIQDPPQQV